MNRRPSYTNNTNTKYKTYDKIYFIAPNPENITNDINKLYDLFKDHDDFLKEITEYTMDNKYRPNTKTDFISVKLKTTNIKEEIFKSIALKINKKLETDFKVFMKTANETKYTFTPDSLKEKSNDDLNDSINKFLTD